MPDSLPAKQRKPFFGTVNAGLAALAASRQVLAQEHCFAAMDYDRKKIYLRSYKNIAHAAGLFPQDV